MTEQTKDFSELIAEIAKKISEINSDFSTEKTIQFLYRYFKYCEPADLFSLGSEYLAKLVSEHLVLGAKRNPGQPVIKIKGPAKPGFSTSILLVCDDRRFIVDSVIMYLVSEGWSIKEAYHPQFFVHRDDTGKISEISLDEEIADGENESWILLQAFPPLGEVGSALITGLKKKLLELLDLGQRVVREYPAMLAKLWEAIGFLSDSESIQNIGSAANLLRWVGDDHYTFLGFAEYKISKNRLVMVPDSALGVLRGVENSEHIHEIPRKVGVSIGKDPRRSQIHRPAYYDRISIPRLDSRGRVTGEYRFLGLFTLGVYSQSVKAIPYLNEKAEQIVARSGYKHSSHGARNLETTLDTFPRDELLQASVDELYPVIMEIAHLMERRAVRVFSRIGATKRFVYAVVYFPRDRYNTKAREKMQQVLLKAYGGLSIEYQPGLGDSSLARLYFVMLLPEGASPESVDQKELLSNLTSAIQTWDDRCEALMGELSSEQRGIEFSDAYREVYEPAQGLEDLLILNTLSEDSPLAIRMTPEENSTEDKWRLKLFLAEGGVELSKILPLLTSLGMKVVDERTFEFALRGNAVKSYEFGLKSEYNEELKDSTVRDRLMSAVAAGLAGRTIIDPMNRLVVSAGLTWEQVFILRTIAHYLTQTRVNYSERYIAEVLISQKEITNLLVKFFILKFDPAKVNIKEKQIPKVKEELYQALDGLTLLDQDRIMRCFTKVIDAGTRTNAYTASGPFSQGSVQPLVLKLRPRELDFLPDPKPAIESFVHSPYVEGTHLRFSKVARGGLRWSDRKEDFRTEVLGLAQAQMVKNTVIVPSGAKGCFVPQQLPDPQTDREGWMAAGKKAYQQFVEALLSITDNIIDGKVHSPEGVLPNDGEDPYFVVAADKGTATFSDVANKISFEHNFWLGDAFASGGSNGYDHKKMAITSRGAWESTKQHFAILEIKPNDDFTCIGIGDMAGDVFGNGMLASKHIKLIAAFDHRNIFIDPNPDVISSFAERKRLFELPRSSWVDYNLDLISKGGGVFSRSSKAIRINAQIAKALGMENYPSKMTPDQLITSILKAPVDLFFNGGIGTYVKASFESNSHVGDKANDHVRVNGDQVRARCAVEGGNLGWTQAGRVEYSQAGGLINTDFIDNSAGVDTSDHEVNIKVMLDRAMAKGKLKFEERNKLLQSMTEEVANLVLAHNIDQNTALAGARGNVAALTGVYDRWIGELESQGYLKREVEGLPSSEILAERQAKGEGLFGPELATLMSWTKIWLAEKILDSDLPEDPYVQVRLTGYFPTELQEKFEEEIKSHPLKREIITTVVVNRYINSQGISSIYRLSQATDSTPVNVIRAQLASRSIFKTGLFETVSKRDVISAKSVMVFNRELRELVESATNWLLNQHLDYMDTQGIVDKYSTDVQQVISKLRDLLPERFIKRFDSRIDSLELSSLKPNLKTILAGADVAFLALPIVEIATELKLDVSQVAKFYFGLVDELHLDELMDAVESLSEYDRWDELARSALISDLARLRDELVRNALAVDPAGVVEQWINTHDRAKKVIDLVNMITAKPDLAKISVVVRAIRSLI